MWVINLDFQTDGVKQVLEIETIMIQTLALFREHLSSSLQKLSFFNASRHIMQKNHRASHALRQL